MTQFRLSRAEAANLAGAATAEAQRLRSLAPTWQWCLERGIIVYNPLEGYRIADPAALEAALDGSKVVMAIEEAARWEAISEALLDRQGGGVTVLIPEDRF